MNKKLFLRRGREDSIKRFHPWIFSGAVKSMDAGVNDGDVVDVYSSENEFLCRGHYEPGSIAVRILTFVDEEINEQFFKDRISGAYRLRKRCVIPAFEDKAGDMYRLVHGEGDLLSGLVIDIYGDMAVMQAHSVGMGRSCELIAKALTGVCDEVKYVYNKSSSTLPKGKYTAGDDGWLSLERELPVTVYEYGNRFEINPGEGQKTGFFIDQRENRLLLQKYSRGASALNLFAYTGAFSVYALRGGAAKVDSVDSSARAIAMANRNVELNFGSAANHRGTVSDVSDYLRKTEDVYDMIISDPPAFAKHQSAVKNALRAYIRLNAKAMEKLAPSGGILFTFSCSQAVNKQQFLQALFSAAAIAGRQASILHCLNQPADHPVNIYHPEGDYLKGLVVYVK
ncbi:MAG: class I SAM-dependent rRNA methyltransferase [Prevotellaceae bacterium]|jgi:23S rRNA (cytosine1962-C5)-methyltransferase|nr:class I SAM-dependent rRNA methyltransferase [Prevotellaceae bacterium]